jgi:hypothetical protein
MLRVSQLLVGMLLFDAGLYGMLQTLPFFNTPDSINWEFFGCGIIAMFGFLGVYNALSRQ